MISDGMISERVAPEIGARILNYTNKAQYSGTWNAATRACRGLILADDDKVLARPFPKFFNPDEPCAPPIPTGNAQPVHVTEKMDGSLGIIYPRPSGGLGVSTRGSLTSDQAVQAQIMLDESYPDLLIPEGVTPLVEIIFPSNRIVVDYGERRDLILLAVIDNATGKDLALDVINWPGPSVGNGCIFSCFDDAVKEFERNSRTTSEGGLLSEGYVIRFLGSQQQVPDLRFKLKFADYIEAHRQKFGLNAVRVWEAAAVDYAVTDCWLDHSAVIGKALHISPQDVEGLLSKYASPLTEMRSVISEEHLEWFDAQAAQLHTAATKRIALYRKLLTQAKQTAVDDSDKAFALAAQQAANEAGVHPGPLYALRRGRREALLWLWRDIKPEPTPATVHLT